MTNQKTTKNSLFTSIMSLVLCCAMLVGTTFAWFTDTVSSGTNTIKAGNLDIDLHYATQEDANDGQIDNWIPVTTKTKLFNSDLWEPGHTEILYLKISNKGSLTLDYKLGLNIIEEIKSKNVYGKDMKLSNHLKVGLVQSNDFTYFANRSEVTSSTYDKLDTLANFNYSDEITLEMGETKFVKLAVFMPTSAGNDANYKLGADIPTVNFGLNLVATQAASEEDSFDNDYDEEASYTVPEIQQILANGGTVILGDNLKVAAIPTNIHGNTAILMTKGGVIDGQGNKISVTDLTSEIDSAIYTTGGTIKNVIIDSGDRSIYGYCLDKDLYLENVHIDAPVYTMNFQEAKNNSKIIANNSTFKGWTSYGSQVVSAAFTDCYFGKGATQNFMQAWTDTTITRGEFESGYEINMAKGKLTLIDCTLNGVLITPDNVTDLLYNDAQATDGTVAVINN